MQAPAYLIAYGLPGQLWIMPHPPTETLPDAVASYAARGIDTVVSMLPTDDVVQLGLGDEAALCTAQDIEFLNHPIVDFGLPDADTFPALTDSLATRIRAGRRVAVHCRAGVGRSGMATACTLIRLGWDRDKAVRAVSEARGVSIPDTVAQAEYIAAFEQNPK